MTHRVGFKIQRSLGLLWTTFSKCMCFTIQNARCPQGEKVKFRGARRLGGVAFKGRLD